VVDSKTEPHPRAVTLPDVMPLAYTQGVSHVKKNLYASHSHAFSQFPQCFWWFFLCLSTRERASSVFAFRPGADGRRGSSCLKTSASSLRYLPLSI